MAEPVQNAAFRRVNVELPFMVIIYRRGGGGFRAKQGEI